MSWCMSGLGLWVNRYENVYIIIFIFINCVGIHNDE